MTSRNHRVYETIGISSLVISLFLNFEVASRALIGRDDFNFYLYPTNFYVTERLSYEINYENYRECVIDHFGIEETPRQF